MINISQECLCYCDWTTFFFISSCQAALVIYKLSVKKIKLKKKISIGFNLTCYFLFHNDFSFQFTTALNLVSISSATRNNNKKV